MLRSLPERFMSGTKALARAVSTHSCWDRRTRVATCTVNNWALDFKGNYDRIVKTCEEANRQGARVRLGPELEICGYGCADHLFELDTEFHSWEMLSKLTEQSKQWPDMLIITGLPTRFKGFLHNCMAAIKNGQLIFVRPKLALADSSIYRESRWFVPWQQPLTFFEMPIKSEYKFNQTTVPFGDGIIESEDNVRIGFEICEEMWCSQATHIGLAHQAVDIICNASGSYLTLGGSEVRINQLVLGACGKVGGVYLYANHRGCDGDRVYYDGASTIAQNGLLLAQIPQFDIEDTSVATATVDLNSNTTARQAKSSTAIMASMEKPVPTVKFDGSLTVGAADYAENCTEPLQNIEKLQMSAVEDLCHGPPAYLWSYLRRSGMAGFYLALSGGQDSSAVATLIWLMCHKVCTAVKKARMNGEPDDPAYYLNGEKIPEDPNELCGKILYTCYMGTVNSSSATKKRAEDLAREIGANHSSIIIDDVVEECVNVANTSLGIQTSFDSDDNREVMALQNIQARSRMVLTYLLSQLALVKEKRSGGLLVLGSANVDEGIVGYVTKYDCSAADINPIGSVGKLEIRRFLHHVHDQYGIKALKSIVESTPTAELKPLKDGELEQTDEGDVGLSYEELATIGMLRKPGVMGPYMMFLKLLQLWSDKYTPEEIESKLKNFWTRYTVNRHKSTVSTPAIHCENRSPDDNRNDHRPFLYPSLSFQFDRIRDKVNEINASK